MNTSSIQLYSFCIQLAHKRREKVVTVSQVKRDTNAIDYSPRVADYKRVIEDMKTISRVYGKHP